MTVQEINELCMSALNAPEIRASCIDIEECNEICRQALLDEAYAGYGCSDLAAVYDQIADDDAYFNDVFEFADCADFDDELGYDYVLEMDFTCGCHS